MIDSAVESSKASPCFSLISAQQLYTLALLTWFSLSVFRLNLGSANLQRGSRETVSGALFLKQQKKNGFKLRRKPNNYICPCRPLEMGTGPAVYRPHTPLNLSELDKFCQEEWADRDKLQKSCWFNCN